MFATPAYVANNATNYTTSMFQLAGHCAKMGLDCDLLMHAESLVTSARNKLVATFLANDYTHLFFIDADVGFGPAAAFRLLLADLDVAAGVYPLKEIIWPEDGVPVGTTQKIFEDKYYRYPVNLGRSVVGVDVDQDGFFPLKNATTGFMCIKRGVFTKMIEAYPDLFYVPAIPRDSNEKVLVGDGLYWSFFDDITDPKTHERLSEDYAFCKRWVAIGGVVKADVYSKLTHLGQYLWQGDLAASITARAKAVEFGKS